MWKNLSPREKRLVAVTLVIVVSALVYRVVFLPTLTDVWALEDRSANLQLSIAEMERALARGERIESQYKKYEAIISQKGTDMDEAIAFLRTIDDITSANDMVTVDQWQLPEEEKGYYKIFSLRLVVKTRPVHVARFLDRLEKGQELIRVQDIMVKALDDAENLSVSMKLTKVVAAEKKGES